MTAQPVVTVQRTTSPAALPQGMSRRTELVLLALIVVVGLALRAETLGQPLLGDEMLTYAIATRDSIGGAIDGVRTTELNPPLYYVLAWLAAKIGDPTFWIRIPALVFGTASIPLVWLVGRRLVGTVPALIGAGLFAIAPFAVYYGSEARAYSTVTCLALASTYALLRALDGGPRGWWAAYAVATAGVVYAHYTGVFVLVAQVVWAAWTYRDRWRPLAIASGAAVLLYVPWIPFIREYVQLDVIHFLFPLTPRNFVRGLARVFPGHPYVGLGEVPGKVGMGLIALGLAIAAAALIARIVRSRAALRPDAGLVLVAMLAAASPAGAVLAEWAGKPIWLPRNLIASLPAVCLLIGLLIGRLPRAVATATAILVFAGVALGTYHGTQPANSRPQYDVAARFVDARARPDDPVLQAPGFLAKGIFVRSFSVNFERPHRLYTVEAGQAPAALAQARRTGRLFVIAVRTAEVPVAPVPGPPFRLVERHEYEGIFPIEALEYATP